MWCERVHRAFVCKNIPDCVTGLAAKANETDRLIYCRSTFAEMDVGQHVAVCKTLLHQFQHRAQHKTGAKEHNVAHVTINLLLLNTD